MGSVQVTVVVDEEHDVDAVVAALRERGMQVDRVLAEVGMVTGTSDADAVESLAAVDGVLSVDTAASVQLPPPESPLQ
jgi:hypothetical protein